MSPHRLERLNSWLQRLLLVILLALAALVALYLQQGGWERLQASRTMARFFPGDVFQGPQVAIISGHRGFDSGAVCEDGLMEAVVNANVAERVAKFLQAQGVSVLLLDEFDPQLEGLHSRALVSIHADSCVDQSGFKVASAKITAIPAEDAALVSCLRKEYAEATGLDFRTAAITRDMTEYHAFQRIAADTPGAIIEIGYLGGDRALLENHPEEVAAGIAAGIVCFLDEQDAREKRPPPTP